MRIALHEARNAKGVTQEKTAQHLNITVRHYRSIELGKSGTSEDNWIKLYEYLQPSIPLQDVMRNTI